MSTLSTHALNTASGKPAAGLPLLLEFQPDAPAWQRYCRDRYEGKPSAKTPWQFVARGVTNGDGRCPNLLAPDTLISPGIYRMSFDTAAYFEQQGVAGFYPLAQVIFEVRAEDEHYHIPLLLSPYGYTTYRGS